MIANVKGKVVAVGDVPPNDFDKEPKVEAGVLVIMSSAAEVVKVKMPKSVAPKVGSDVDYPVIIRGGKNGVVYAGLIS